MIPKITGKELYSIRLANVHFWLILAGQLALTIVMWAGGILQGAMLKATNPDGSLTYSFLDTLNALYPYYRLRFAAGAVYYTGILLFVWNIIRTVIRKPAAIGV
jgi:cytochrome c oxidase cbb3-type subunit 1